MSHVVTAALAAVVVALAGNLLVAPYSSDGYQALETQKLRLETNVAELEAIHADLVAQMELLARSSDAVRVQARQLGYYAEGETVIRFADSPRVQQSQSPGTIVHPRVEHLDRRNLVRLAAAVAAALVFTLLVLTDGGTQSSIRRHSR